MPRSKVLTEPELVAYKDGYDAAATGQKQHDRRATYKDQRDRDAFNKGWAARIAWIEDHDIPCRLIGFPAGWGGEQPVISEPERSGG